VKPPAFVPPQLATLADAPPTGGAWVHEVKLDGYRLLAVKSGARCRLVTRNRQDWTRRYADLAAQLARLAPADFLLDGEVVALDDEGRSSFQRLQGPDGAALRYVAFDLLHHDGEDLRPRPLDERRARLQALLRGKARNAPVALAERLRGDDPLAEACRRGLEGVVSKRRKAPYAGGRGDDWIKAKCGQRQEFVVAGFTEPAGARKHLGALVLAVRDGDGLRYAGRVGTGFDTAAARALRKRLDALRAWDPPLALPPGDARARRGVQWVRPELVAEVAYTGFTRDGLLRHPSYKGLREDKPADEVRLEGPHRVAGVTLTHPDKVLFADAGVTKRGLAAYYELAAPYMLAELRNRPLSLVRCPQGAEKRCFFQRHWAVPKAAGIATVRVLEEEGDVEPYPVVRELAGLVTLVQYGALEIHQWNARADRLEAPDRLVFDLDPAPDVPWARVVAAARSLRGRLSALELAAWVKTSGGKGLHVVVPIDRRHAWAETAAFAEAMAAAMAADEPRAYLAQASKAQRTGRIFVDWLRNTRGASTVAAWSTRARPGATVSLPVPWPDLDEAGQLPLAEVVALLKGRYRDPWAELASTRQRLPATLPQPSRRDPPRAAAAPRRAVTPRSSRRRAASAPRR
jgi:bifunctional non-homologous end joining protein LigD